MTQISLVSQDGTEEIVCASDGTVEDAISLFKRSPFVSSSIWLGSVVYDYIPTDKRFKVVEIPYINQYWPDGVQKLEKVIKSLPI